MKMKKEEFKALVDDVLSIFPIPEIPKLAEEDLSSIMLNLLTKPMRETVDMTIISDLSYK